MDYLEDLPKIISRVRQYMNQYKEMKMESALKAWVARDENGMLYLYLAKPKKYKSKWYPNIRSDYFEIDRKFFPEVKWEDDEPTKVKIVIDK